MRFVPLYSRDEDLIELWQNRTLELCRLSQKTGIVTEINLRGLDHPWGRMHPPQFLIEKLVQSEVQFYVGSDSHNLQSFLDSIPRVQQLHNFLRKCGRLRLPVTL